MGAKPSAPAAQPGPSNQVPMGQPVGVVPMGQPVLTEEDRKIESMKWKSKLLNIIACMAVATVSVPTVYYGSERHGGEPGHTRDSRDTRAHAGKRITRMYCTR